MLQSEILPYYHKKIKLPSNTTKVKVTINASQVSETAIITDNTIDVGAASLDIQLATERKERYAIIRFLPFVKQGSELYPLEGFTLSIDVLQQGSSLAKGPFVNTSALATGDIYKVSVTQAGIHAIDTELLQNMGIDISSIDPSKVRILGQGGGIQPEANEEERIDDLAEIVGLRQGLQDGSWDSNDKILFYAEGPDKMLSTEDGYEFYKNIYTEKNFYFIQLGAETANNIGSKPSIDAADNTYTEYTLIQHFEEDKINLLDDFISTEGSGQEWFGDQYFNITEFDYSGEFLTNVYELSQGIDVKGKFVGRSSSQMQVNFAFGNENISRSIPSTNTGKVDAAYGRRVSFDERLFPSQLNTVGVSFEKGGNDAAKGWIDYLQIAGQVALQYTKSPLLIRARDMDDFNTVRFSVEGYEPGLAVWELSKTQPIGIEYTVNGSALEFSAQNDGLFKEYLIFNPGGNFSRPSFEETVANQNLHGLNNTEYLIISHNDFISEAERLADHHRSRSDINIEVVDIQHIFNEFSSGKNDPTAIRDMARMLYERNPDFRYLLLFGDGSFDQRNLNEELGFRNYIPVFETHESLEPIVAYPTDDYYGLLDIEEGGNITDGLLDIGVGRIPVNTLEEASDVVDKILHYETSSNTFGPWRTQISFAADDEDGTLHIGDANLIAEKTESHSPIYNQKKVYFDAYPQITTPGGERYPDVQADLVKNIENGLLVQCYLGHGGPTGWAQERVLQENHIQALRNYDRLTLFVTATCSLTGYDDPSIVSAGEYAILNPQGAAVALFSTVRAVFTSANKRLTEAVFDNIFIKQEGQNQKLGEIIRLAKNEETGENTRKFTLIGDPYMALNSPEHNIRLTTFNEKVIDTSFADTIKALDLVTIEGLVEDYLGNTLSDFNGELSLTVYDKETITQTIRNNEDSGAYSFEQRKNILFKGKASVVNGLFNATFLLPKDINFNYGLGRISMYATDQETDAAGYFEDFVVGGSSEGTITDNDGPQIDLYMNDESFVYGGITNEEPTFLAFLTDENGINISGTSIGHDLSASLDDDTQNPIILNEYYEAALDDYTSGTIRYPMNKLEAGRHEIELTAWDNLNNASSKKIEFLVVNQDGNGIEQVFNYPNPFSTSTEFMFEHDLANSNISIVIKIFSVSGKLLKTIVDHTQTTGFRQRGIMWNGRDDFGNRLANGIYLYKINIHDEMTGISRESEFEKLVIIN